MTIPAFAINRLLFCSLLLPCLAGAEIREIPAEEMTEAYISDTTVIVRKKQPQEDSSEQKTKTSVRVSPSQEAYREGENTAAEHNQSEILMTGDNRAERTATELSSQQAYDFSVPDLDPQQAARDAYLRDILGLEAGTPIDYSNLQFPTSISTDITPPAGVGYDIAPGQFAISIPNAGNYPERRYATPGGEYQVDVTPSEIIFIINLPQK